MSKIDNELVKIYAKDKRKEWNLGKEPIQDLFSLVESKGFLVLKFPNNKGISGLHLKKKVPNGVKSCIYINTYEPVGRLNFSLAHELYHVFYEESDDCLSLNKNRDTPIEKRAEVFASNFLIPRETLAEVLLEHNINRYMWLQETVVFDIQKYFNVSFVALIYAINELKNYEQFSELVPKNIGTFWKYNRKEYFDELEMKTLKYDKTNILNSVQPQYEWPNGLKENIEHNLKYNIIDFGEVEDILNFFD